MRLKSKTKLITLLVSLLMIGAATINSTVAFLFTQDGPVVNQFNPSQVRTSVYEEFTDDENGVYVKEDVTIQNTGDTTAWIRAAVVVTWQDAAGNVYGQMPVIGVDCNDDGCTEHDCHISYNTTDWEQKDGFWYCKNPISNVEPNNVTPVLIETCKPIKNAPATDYYLTVEILGSGIQTFQGIATWDAAWDKATKSEAVTTE